MQNKKYLILLVLLLCSCVTVFSAKPTEFPEDCYLPYIDDTVFDVLISNNNMSDILYNIAQEVIDSNYTIKKRYDIYFDRELYLSSRYADYSVQIIFNNENGDDVLGVYSSHETYNDINLYIPTIYNHSQNYNYTLNEYKIFLSNILTHELTHFIDLTSKMINPEYTFNIEVNYTGTYWNVTNRDYFINNLSLLNFDNDIPRSINWTVAVIPSILNGTSNYTESKYRNEIVARYNALCLKDVNNGYLSYNYSNSSVIYDICNKFNFYSDDVDLINLIYRDVAYEYFLQHPEIFEGNYSYSRLLDEEICIRDTEQEVRAYLQSQGINLDNILNQFSLIAFLIILSIIFFMMAFIIYIIRRIKNKISKM